MCARPRQASGHRCGGAQRCEPGTSLRTGEKRTQDQREEECVGVGGREDERAGIQGEEQHRIGRARLVENSSADAMEEDGGDPGCDERYEHTGDER